MFRFLKPNRGSESDAELLARFQKEEDADALGRLYARYAELVYGLCLKYLEDEVEAEDAVMAIFESLLQKVGAHQIDHFRNWLYTFVRNHCFMQLRKEKRLLKAKREADFMQSNGLEHPFIEENAIEEEEADLTACIDGLQEQQKACIEAFYLQEQSYKEIAEARDESLGRIRSYIQNGRRNLRLCMEALAKAREIE